MLPLFLGMLLATNRAMPFDNLLEWFSGKSRETIVTFTIPALEESAALEYWKKGVARSVRATLNKQNVAMRWAKEVEAALEVDYKHPLHWALFHMHYGAYERAPDMLNAGALDKLHATPYVYTPKKGPAQSVNATIERWARANGEVAELVNLLDARRPKPVIVMKTLSPTVAQNLSAYIGIDVSTIQSPPMHGEWAEFEYKGKKWQVYLIVIDWPEGTQDNKSRFFHSGHHRQCQACGHAIQDPFNWVPILAYGHDHNGKVLDHNGKVLVPYSLWVGRDCAQSLFGCEIEGDAIYSERQS